MNRLLVACVAAAVLLPLAAFAGPKVLLETSLGAITLELEAEKAPKSTENFLNYVKAGFYDGTQFHRVIQGFMVQGGGFTADMVQKPTQAPIENEAKNGLKNLRGTIAMARTNNPQSATSQFFVNHKDNAALDYPSRDGWGYAVFGKVVEGMPVVDKIAGVPTGSAKGMGDVPISPVLIKQARLVGEGVKKP
ncbi:MAG: peptidylprolyl isomerase [Pseudomonadota bacterium]